MHTESILSFLNDLRLNNNREWMQENRSRYLDSKKQFESIISTLINQIASFDVRFGDVGHKECVLRLNRDIRFSQDKTPYRTNYAAVIAPQGGKKSVLPCYYVAIGPLPESSFLAGGLYTPKATCLKKVRQEIDYNGEELLAILEDKTFMTNFGTLEGEKLKRPPRGYEASNAHIDLLKRKSFMVRKQLEQNQLRNEVFIDEVMDLFKLMKPFNDFFFRALE